MNKILLLFSLMAFSAFSSVAQQRNLGITGPKINKTASERGVQFDGSEVLSGPIRITAHQQQLLNGATPNNEGAEEWIGETYYDLQTNGTTANRIIAEPDCEISVVWTGHSQTEDNTFPNRGTFFQEAENCGPFPASPGARIEPTSRTGWPNILKLADGSNVVINHTFASTNQTLLVRQNADGSWNEESTLPANADLGFLWPRAVAAGQTIHVIGVTGPNDADSPVYERTYEGLTQALLYFRSDDGGQTWPIQNYIIPGITSAEIKGINADAYSLVADDSGNVAIGIFLLTEDVILLKSTENGDIGSWSSRIVHDFPLDQYELGSSYSLEDIGGVDPRGPGIFYQNSNLRDSMFVGTCDGTGSVTLDANGMAHISYSELFIYSDSTLQEGFVNFYYLPTGIAYWNESFADNEVNYIEAVEVGLDVDGSVSYDFQDNAIYVNGITSPVSSSNIEVTGEGEIIITYQQAMENLVSANATQPQHYSQIHVTASEDGGATWACPYNIINNDLSLFGFLVPTTEAIFPHTTLIEEDHLAIWYQFDDEPGLNLDADEGDPINSNTIAELSIRVNDYLDTDVNCTFTTDVLEVVDAEAFSLSIAPNPAKDITRISYSVDASMEMQLTLTSITGQELSAASLRPNAPGTYTYDLNTSDLSVGIYLISLRNEAQVATTRLMIVK